jgi:hypothetical protein
LFARREDRQAEQTSTGSCSAGVQLRFRYVSSITPPLRQTPARQVGCLQPCLDPSWQGHLMFGLPAAQQVSLPLYRGFRKGIAPEGSRSGAASEENGMVEGIDDDTYLVSDIEPRKPLRMPRFRLRFHAKKVIHFCVFLIDLNLEK